MGVLGGGCSARSLLTIELTTEGGVAVSGTPLIKVTQGEEEVRIVDNKTVIVLGKDSTTSVGVYLDGDVSGAVEVTATLRVSEHCRWSGETAGKVRSGQRTDVQVMLAKGDCAGPQPDGGTDARDGGVKDAGPTLLGDGGQDADLKLQACTDYCAKYHATCMNWGAAAFPHFECVNSCRRWPLGDSGSADPRDDTLACRLYYLRKTDDPDASILCSMCPLASPASEACGTTVDAGRTYACFGDASADSD